MNINPTFINRPNNINSNSNDIDYIKFVNDQIANNIPIDPNSIVYQNAINQYNEGLKRGATERLDVPPGFCGRIDANTGMFRVEPEPGKALLAGGISINVVPEVTTVGPLSAIPYPIDQCLAVGLPGSTTYTVASCGTEDGDSTSFNINWFSNTGEGFGLEDVGGNNTFLWRAHSHKDGNLVILLPAYFAGQSTSCSVIYNNGNNVDTAQFLGYMEGSDGRLKFRYSHPGEYYGNNIIVRENNGYEWNIPYGGLDYEINGGSGGIYVPPTPGLSKIRGIMASDWIQMLQLQLLRDTDAGILLNAGFNTIYCPIDLGIIHNGQGHGDARPYIGAGRTVNAITDLAVNNIKWIANKGFNVMIVTGNEPTVRHGLSNLMSGLNFIPGLSPSLLYTTAHLESEINVWTDIMNKVGEYIYGAMLYLEPSVSKSISFQQSLAHEIRLMGFGGKLFTDGIGEGKAGRIAQYNVLTAEESAGQNSLDAWLQNTADLKDADGWDTDGNHSWVSKMLASPGPQGLVMWYDDYRGDANGPGTLESWMLG